MPRLTNPITGKTALKIRVWFTSSGSSPDVPYFERKRYEERLIAVRKELVSDEEPWAISTEHGETFEP